MRRLLSLSLVAPLLAVFPGCYEIEPEVPEDYVGGPAEPGWPPPAVYSADVFHPANRLYQRLFALGGESAVKGLAVPSADIPFSLRQDFSAVDRAEVAALLWTLQGRAPRDPSALEPSERALLQTDVLWIAARLAAREAAREAGPGDGALPGAAQDPAERIVRDLSRAALILDADGPLQASALPPPLREAGWLERSGAVPMGLRPSLADLRWTRLFRRLPDQGGAETALLRLRIGVAPGGGPVLSKVGSEAWFLSPGKEGASEARAFHLRRARLLRGEDPWEEVQGSEEIAILDPGDPGKVPLTGKLPGLCAGCHGATLRKEEAPPGPGTDGQEGDARRALEALFFKSR